MNSRQQAKKEKVGIQRVRQSSSSRRITDRSSKAEEVEIENKRTDARTPLGFKSSPHFSPNDSFFPSMQCAEFEFLRYPRQGQVRVHHRKDRGQTKTNSTNAIVDSGIEMTENEFMSNLVMIDEAVTKAFEKAMCDGSNTSLIGQFGAVSFPAYMISDKVRAVIKNKTDEQHIAHMGVRDWQIHHGTKRYRDRLKGRSSETQRSFAT